MHGSSVGNRRAFRGGALAAALLVLVLSGPVARADDGPPYPRLVNVYLHGAVDPAVIPSLARWDVLVLDPVWTSAQLQQLRALNPALKIYFYVCPYCIAVDPPPADAWRGGLLEYARQNDLWWRNADRTIASDWPRVQLVNVTEHAPRGPLGKWTEYLAARVEWIVASRPELDGIFFDNFWKGMSWQQGTSIHVDSDCNPTHRPDGCDGVADQPAVLDTLWNRGLRALARDVRGRFDRLAYTRGGRPVQLVANAADDYFPWLNGTLYERFPTHGAPEPGNPHGYSWTRSMLAEPAGYLVAPFRTTPYTVQMINAGWAGTWSMPERSPEFERHKRFTLVSALLGDGYYSLDASHGHGSVWWEPEYDGGGLGKGYLGHPRWPMRRIGVASGSELVQNGSFSGIAGPWQAQASNATGTYTLDRQTYRSGTGAARLDVPSLATGGSYKLYQSVPVLGGSAYTLGFWARASATQEILVHLYGASCLDDYCLSDQRFELSTNWRYCEIPFVATGHAVAGLNFLVRRPGTVWIDDVSLRAGHAAVYQREFERGIVLLNATAVPQRIPLAATYYRLQIPGSSEFDGRPVAEEVVPPYDGRILLRTPHPTDTERGGEVRSGLRLESDRNPFRPAGPAQLELRFSTPMHVAWRLAVYDVAGRLVRVLQSGAPRAEASVEGAVQRVRWDGRDAQGRMMAPGVYFCRLEGPGAERTLKLTVVR